MTLLLVDGANILMRCAFGGDIAPEQAAPTACALIERAAAYVGASHLVVALDSAAPSWRKLEYPEYKAHRTTDTRAWIAAGFTEFRERGWHCECVPGFEADDILATLARRAAKRMPVTILSNDSDVLALTECGAVVLVPLTGGQFRAMSHVEVREKYDLTQPSQLADYKALVGETGDNVPGVKGIGPKKAALLLKLLGNVEGIIKAGETNFDRWSRTVYLNRDTARLALRLVTLREDVPVPPVNPRDCALARRVAA